MSEPHFFAIKTSNSNYDMQIARITHLPSAHRLGGVTFALIFFSVNLQLSICKVIFKQMESQRSL